jgi:hypothetical protein
MFKKVIYFITKQNRQISAKESFIKNKREYNQPNKKVFDIIIRKYHSSNTNNSCNNGPPNNFNAFIIASIIVGSYFAISKKNL